MNQLQRSGGGDRGPEGVNQSQRSGGGEPVT